METPPPPRYHLPRLSFTDSKLDEQTIWTTAGTRYNPEAIKELKPPTRRCRSNRPFDLNLSLQGDRYPEYSPSPTRSVPTYFPLQQNDHRAHRPGSPQPTWPSQEPATPTPTSKMNNSYNRLPFGPSSTLNLSIPGQTNNLPAAKRDDRVNKGPLRHMTTKGILNLASFENSVQDSARKVLLGATNGSYISDAESRNTASPASITSSDMVAKDRGMSIYGPMSTGAGAPRPLTAGPPGQRQYRASTFEGTIKALAGGPGQSQTQLHGGVPIPGLPKQHSFAHIQAPQTASQTLINQRSTGQSCHPTEFQTFPLRSSQGRQTPLHFQVGPDSVSNSTTFEDGPNAYFDTDQMRPARNFSEDRTTEAADKLTGAKTDVTLSLDEAKESFPETLQSDSQIMSVRDGGVHLDNDFSESKDHSDVHSETTIDRVFYSGSDASGLGKNARQVVRDHDYENAARKLGVIGEERRRIRSDCIKILMPRDVSFDDPAKHAEPVMVAVLANLIKYRDEHAQDHVDPSLVSSSPGANKSFFEMKEKRSERPRAFDFYLDDEDDELYKRASQRYRRGY